MSIEGLQQEYYVVEKHVSEWDDFVEEDSHNGKIKEFLMED